MTRSQEIALVIMGLVGLWLASGLVRCSGEEDAQRVERPLPRVKVQHSEAQKHTVYLISQGFTEADRKIEIKAEVSGRIEELPAGEGDFVKAGDILAKINLRDKQARMDEAKAMLRQRTLEFEASKKLNLKKFRSDTALALSEAQLNEAQAQVAAMQREIDDTIVKAPFDGVLEEREVEIGTFVDVGDVICNLVDLNPLLAVVNVSEVEVKQLKLGQKARIRLTQGEELEGTITFLSRVADENTRAFQVEISMENNDYKLQDGLSLEAGIPINDTLSHSISPGILTLDSEGRVGVKIIDAQNAAQFIPIKIVDSTSEEIWVMGLPKKVGLIVTGQEFITDGQIVNPIRESKDALPD